MNKDKIDWDQVVQDPEYRRIVMAQLRLPPRDGQGEGRGGVPHDESTPSAGGAGQSPASH